MQFGRVPSPPDVRDFPLSKILTYAAVPPRDIRVTHIPASFDQGDIGCCVAASGAKLISAIEHKQRGVWIPMSVKHGYGYRRDTDFQGEGMIPREAGLNYTRVGVPRYSLLPGIANYPDSKAAISPVLAGEGLPNRIKAIVRLSSLQDIYDYMSLYDLPIWFGFTVFENIGNNGFIPAPGGEILGGHMVLGVELKLPRLVIQNTWLNWGSNWEGSINLSEHSGWEAWGMIPEDEKTLIDRPQEVLLTIGNPNMFVDGKTVVLDQGPIIQNGRTLVPLRALSEILGAKVDFYGMADGKHMILLRWNGERDKLTEV